MRHSFSCLFAAGIMGLGASVAGCTANIHDFTIDDISLDLETDVDVDQIQAGDTVPIHVSPSDDVNLVAPGVTPPEDKLEISGHFEVFLDSRDSTPLAVSAQFDINVVIPESTTEGEHVLICVFVKFDGSVSSERAQLKISVKAKVS